LTVAIAISRRIQEADIHRLTGAQGIVCAFTSLHLAGAIVGEIGRQWFATVAADTGKSEAKLYSRTKDLSAPLSSGFPSRRRKPSGSVY
jgi:hypothetical protein